MLCADLITILITIYHIFKLWTVFLFSILLLLLTSATIAPLVCQPMLRFFMIMLHNFVITIRFCLWSWRRVDSNGSNWSEVWGVFIVLLLENNTGRILDCLFENIFHEIASVGHFQSERAINKKITTKYFNIYYLSLPKYRVTKRNMYCEIRCYQSKQNKKITPLALLQRCILIQMKTLFHTQNFHFIQ